MSHITLIKKQLLFMAIGSTFMFVSPVIATIVGRRSQPIEKLPNNTYLFCDLPALKPDFTQQAMCFEFKKVGNRIFGTYYPDRSDFDEICIEGTVKQNIITGWALEFVEQPLASHFPNAKGKKIVNWDKQGHLQVGKRKIVKSLHPHENPPTLGIIKFDKAQLDLTRFYIYEDYKKDISLCQY